MNMTKSDFFFMLLRSALWQTHIDHFDMSTWEYKEVVKFAEKQCVLGLVTDCLRTNNVGLPKKCVIHMLKLQNSLTIENTHINENLKQLVDLLKRHGIDYVIVKGQTLGTLYPKPLLRVPGDIDFFVPSTHKADTLDILSINWKIDKFDYNPDGKEIAFKYKKTNFELHNSLLLFENKRVASYFSQLVEESGKVNVYVGECEIHTLEPTLNIFYTFGHLYHHFRSEGIALRQLCDLALLLHAHIDSIDKERLNGILRQTGYTRAFATFGHILVEKLGLPNDEFPIKITNKDVKMAKKVLKVILGGGNWGKYSRNGNNKKGMIHALETGWIRISHDIVFFTLSPKENFFLLVKEIPRRVVQLMKRI